MIGGDNNYSFPGRIAMTSTASVSFQTHNLCSARTSDKLEGSQKNAPFLSTSISTSVLLLPSFALGKILIWLSSVKVSIYGVARHCQDIKNRKLEKLTWT